LFAKEDFIVKKPMLAVAAMILCTSLSYAQETATVEAFRKSFPNVKADRIGEAEIAGLYEVQAGNNIFYFDPRKEYLLFGDIVTKEGRNVSAEKRQDLLSRQVKEIPLGKGLKIGKGKNVVIEFTDPDCPFCRKEAEWFSKENREEVTRYIFFYPIAQLHPGAEAKARYILSAKDGVKAYHEVMSGALDKIDPAKIASTKEAAALLAEHKELAAKAGVFATPTLWVNGKHVSGADIRLIEKYLKGEK
jgi:thiol:disulfide interchange protein DsbC